MIDPRNDIVALFTNGRISASSDMGTKYIKVDLREDNKNSEITGNDLGAMILEAPDNNMACINVNGKTYEDVATIICNLWIRKAISLKNPDAFVKNIINAFENKIIDNHLSLAGCRNIVLGGSRPVKSQSKEVYRRTIVLYAVDHKIRV